MINDGGLQIFMVGLIVVLEGIVVYYLTAEHYEERYRRMVKQWTYSLDTLSESNTKLRDKNGELTDQVKQLEFALKLYEQGLKPEGATK